MLFVGIAEADLPAAHVEFGRILWGEAREYPQEIVMADKGKSAGLFHLRIT